MGDPTFLPRPSRKKAAVLEGKELRFAAGSRDGQRSTVWKFISRKDDLYITGRMFGGDAKVSIHASGQGQWSLTSEWVARNRTQGATRHFKRWMVAPAVNGRATPLFSLRFAAADLVRATSNEDTGKVHWLPVPDDTEAIALECFRVEQGQVASQASSGRSTVARMPLASGGSIVLLLNPTSALPQNLAAVRAQMVADLAHAGISPEPFHRAALFVEEDGYAPCLVEVAVLSVPLQAVR